MEHEHPEDAITAVNDTDEMTSTAPGAEMASTAPGVPTAPNAGGGGEKPGLLARLLGAARGPRPGRITMLVAQFVDEAGTDHARHVITALNRGAGVRARPARKSLALDPLEDATEQLALAGATARDWLAKADADLLVWGEVPAPGTTLHMRFVSAAPEDEDRAGDFAVATTLMLPVGFGGEFETLFLAVALAATRARTQAKALRIRTVLPGAVNDIIPSVRNLPPDLTERERASINMCFGNAIAAAATLWGSADLYQVAAQTYQMALSTMARDDAPFDWAMTQKHLGTVLQVLAERDQDTETLEASADAFGAALKILNKDDNARDWAAAQNRMGLTLYRLEARTGDSELLKHALTAFQSALQVLTRAKTPLIWAEVMSNLAQAAQVLGKALHNAEAMEKAAKACRAALEVRTREDMPMMWAATQNNLGTALFLLGHLTGETAHLEAAAEAFEGARDVYVEHGASRMAAITERNLSRVEPLLGTPAGAAAPAPGKGPGPVRPPRTKEKSPA